MVAPALAVKRFYTPREAAQYLSAKQSGKWCTATVRRWVLTGIRVGKERVRLECLRLPGGMAFTQAQLDSYAEALTRAWRMYNGLGGPQGYRDTAIQGYRDTSPASLPRCTPPSLRPGFQRCARHEIGTYEAIQGGSETAIQRGSGTAKQGKNGAAAGRRGEAAPRLPGTARGEGARRVSPTRPPRRSVGGTLARNSSRRSVSSKGGVH